MATELIAALAGEQPRGIEFSVSQVGADHAHLVAGQRLVRRLSALHAVNPHPRGLEVDLVDAQAAGLDGPQGVLEDHGQEQVIAGAVAPILGGGEQRSDLALGEKVLGRLARSCASGPVSAALLPLRRLAGAVMDSHFLGKSRAQAYHSFLLGQKGKSKRQHRYLLSAAI